MRVTKFTGGAVGSFVHTLVIRDIYMCTVCGGILLVNVHVYCKNLQQGYVPGRPNM